MIRLQCLSQLIDPEPSGFFRTLMQIPHRGAGGINSHANAADVLWTGLPLLTATVVALAARVATSMLSAVGLTGHQEPRRIRGAWLAAGK